jgi:hypothetical protein
MRNEELGRFVNPQFRDGRRADDGMSWWRNDTSNRTGIQQDDTNKGIRG